MDQPIGHFFYKASLEFHQMAFWGFFSNKNFIPVYMTQPSTPQLGVLD